MYLVREIMYCKPGKVRALLEKHKALKQLGDKGGMGKMRILTDFAGEQYWTIISELEVESIDNFMSMDGMDAETTKKMEEIMKGYHELVDRGRREIFKIEN